MERINSSKFSSKLKIIFAATMIHYEIDIEPQSFVSRPQDGGQVVQLNRALNRQIETIFLRMVSQAIVLEMLKIVLNKRMHHSVS